MKIGIGRRRVVQIFGGLVRKDRRVGRTFEILRWGRRSWCRGFGRLELFGVVRRRGWNRSNHDCCGGDGEGGSL